jgi:hypothetical protein
MKQAVAVVTDEEKQHAIVGKGTRHFAMNSKTRTVYAIEAIPDPTQYDFKKHIAKKVCTVAHALSFEKVSVFAQCTTGLWVK